MPELLILHAKRAASRHVCAFCRRQARALSYSSAERQTYLQSQSFQDLIQPPPEIGADQSQQLQARDLANGQRQPPNQGRSWASELRGDLTVTPGRLTAQDVLEQLRSEPIVRRRTGRYSRLPATSSKHALQMQPDEHTAVPAAGSAQRDNISAELDVAQSHKSTTLAASQQTLTAKYVPESAAGSVSKESIKSVLKPLSDKFAVDEPRHVAIPDAFEGILPARTSSKARSRARTDLFETSISRSTLRRRNRAVASRPDATSLDVQNEELTSLTSRIVQRRDIVKAGMLLQHLIRLGEHDTKPSLEAYKVVQRMFLKLQLPHQAIQVLFLLQQAGYNMSPSMWTTMLRFSNSEHTNQIWKIMLSQGVQIDEHQWTARVQALIHSHQPDAAMQALDEFASTNSTGDFSSVYGLVEVANIALRTFASFEPYALYVTGLIKWMKEHNLQRDTDTYNTLLNVALRSRLPNTVERLLEHMRKDGVAPDGDTASVMLKRLFENGLLEDKTEAEIPDYLMQMLDTIEVRQLQTTMSGKGYTIAMHEMSKRGNIAACKALFNRMHDRNVRPTKHICTNLTHLYLSQKPPDYEAFEEMFNIARSGTQGWKAQLDVGFYDRAVEHLADAHEILGLDKMEKMLLYMTTESIRPSWPALQSVARAYIERQERALLAGLVRKIESGEGIAAHGFNSDFGRGYFWDMIKKAGVPNGFRALAANAQRLTAAQGPVVDALSSLEA